MKSWGEVGSWRRRTEPAKEKDEEKGLNQCTPANPRYYKKQRSMRANRYPVVRSGSHRIPELPSLPFLSSVAQGVTSNLPAHGQPSARPQLPLPLLILSLPPCYSQLRHFSRAPVVSYPCCLHSSHTAHCQSISPLARTSFPGEMNCARRVAARSHLGPGPGRKGSSQAAFGSRSRRISGWETLGGV